MTPSSTRKFRIAMPPDIFDRDGNLKFKDMGLRVFEDYPQVEPFVLAESRPEIGSDQLAEANGMVVFGGRVTSETVANAADLLVLSRIGVGYDSVNVEACTENDVALLITAGAVDRSVAEATVGWLIALTHHIKDKDRLVRTGAWDDRTLFHGIELRDRTLGVVGLGGIARETIRLLSVFGMNQPLAFDPYLEPSAAATAGAEQVELEELMSRADFISVHCPLNEETRDLIGQRQLELMKPGAYLINTARGGIINEDALYDALANKRIAGAAIDCFDGEPLVEPHRFADFENVLLAPHSIAWTEELFRDIGAAAIRGVAELAMGRVPSGVVNRSVLDRPGFREKWKRLQVA
jgi:phosphoglycerate dehydrogenase-like enzyme